MRNPSIGEEFKSCLERAASSSSGIMADLSNYSQATTVAASPSFNVSGVLAESQISSSSDEALSNGVILDSSNHSGAVTVADSLGSNVSTLSPESHQTKNRKRKLANPKKRDEIARLRASTEFLIPKRSFRRCVFALQQQTSHKSS